MYLITKFIKGFISASYTFKYNFNTNSSFKEHFFNISQLQTINNNILFFTYFTNVANFNTSVSGQSNQICIKIRSNEFNCRTFDFMTNTDILKYFLKTVMLSDDESFFFFQCFLIQELCRFMLYATYIIIKNIFYYINYFSNILNITKYSI